MVNIPMPITLVITAAALYAAYVMGQMKGMAPKDKKTWEARKTYLYIAMGLPLGLAVLSGMGGGYGGGYGGGSYY
jgi:hypothetical protein